MPENTPNTTTDPCQTLVDLVAAAGAALTAAETALLLCRACNPNPNPPSQEPTITVPPSEG